MPARIHSLAINGVETANLWRQQFFGSSKKKIPLKKSYRAITSHMDPATWLESCICGGAVNGTSSRL